MVHDVSVNYDLGGNITRLNRSQFIHPDTGSSPLTTRMDELTYTYDDSYRLKTVSDAGETASTPAYKHFVDGADLSVEYVYDASGKVINDKNRNMDFEYNALGLPRRVVGPSEIRYLYDASGNKLQKAFYRDVQSPYPHSQLVEMDYIGNFLYENGDLVMVYHPEGVIRPTPPSAENTTEYVYDYFIKDYLGNVRVVLTEENATYDTSLVATMEQYRSAWEEDNFNGIGEGREPKPFGYPIDASFPFNQYIAKVVAENDMTIGPSKVMEVRRGEKVKLAARYFFQEDAPGTTYDGLGFLIQEILTSMAAAGAGVLPVGEGTLVNLANGNTSLGTDIFNFLSTEMDTTDMTRPHGYLVWLSYDRDFKLDPTASGALRVVDPNELGTLFSGEIPINETGYLHVYVANGTQGKAINFDNLYITTMEGQTRQINHYYPYGLRMRMGHGKRYNNMYTGKELQTGEFWDASVSTGLEMYDFEARFYDPQLGRWMVPDPVAQYFNPYLGIGNDPINRIDRNGLEDGSINNEDEDGQGGSSGDGGDSDGDSDLGDGIVFGWDGGYHGGWPGTGGMRLANYFNRKSHRQGYYSWLNRFGAVNGSFAPVYHNGNLYHYNASKGGFGYEREFVAADGTAFRAAIYPDGTEVVAPLPLYSLVNEWVSLGSEQGNVSAGGWSLSQTTLTVGGLLYGVGEHVVVNGNRWLGINGKYYNKSWWGNRFTGSRAGAIKVSGYYKIAGRLTFVLGAGIGIFNGANQLSQGNYLGAGKSSLDVTMGVIATYGGVGGIIIGGTYFAMDGVMGIYVNRLNSSPQFLSSEINKATWRDPRYGGIK